MLRMILLPSLGPLHILHPRYNAATVLAILGAANPPVVYLASHSEASLAEGTWREEDPSSSTSSPGRRRGACPWCPWTGRPT